MFMCVYVCVYMCTCVSMRACVCVVCMCICVHVIFTLTIVIFTLTVWELSGPDQELSYISQLCKPYSTHKVCYTHAYLFQPIISLIQHKVTHIGLPLEWQLSYIKPPMTENKAIGLWSVCYRFINRRQHFKIIFAYLCTY